MPGQYFQPIRRIFLNLSGGTVTGDTVFTQGVNVNSLNGDTIYSGGTLLENIIYGITSSISASGFTTFVQPGVNITTGGTGLFPIISVVPSPVFNNLFSSGNTQLNIVSGQTFFVENNILPNVDNNSDLGSTIKRFRSLNIVNGVTVQFTATTKIATPIIELGTIVLTDTNVILTGNTLDGGGW